jgi:ABC-type nitrate/sulfonate/bicarbonate transport system ATPase subunit
VTTVVVTHNIEEAAYLGQRLLVLRQPPHREALVVDNLGAGRPDYRDQPVFQESCTRVRALLEEATDAPA